MTNLRRKNAPVDASRIEYLLAKKFAPSAYAFLPQLRNGTGYGRTVRTADAVAMSLWPSRGIYLHGFEIKVNRGDWLAEMRKPEKAEEIARFCRYWSLVVAEGVCDPLEVPLPWGLIVATPKALTVTREAQPLECEPATLAIVASILRNVNERIPQFKDNYIHIDDLEGRVAAEVEKAVDAKRLANDRAARDHAELAEKVRQFEAASGVRIDDPWRGAEKIGAVVKLLLESGPRQVTSGLLAHVGRCIATLEEVRGRLQEAELGDVNRDSLSDERVPQEVDA